jgi:hypothetical protein
MGCAVSHAHQPRIVGKLRNVGSNIYQSNESASTNSSEEVSQEQNTTFAAIPKDLLRATGSGRFLGRLGGNHSIVFKNSDDIPSPSTSPVPRRNSSLNRKEGSRIYNSLARPRFDEANKKISAAILIQRRIRGMEARAFAASERVSKAAEKMLHTSLNPLLSPAENACKLLLDIASVPS